MQQPPTRRPRGFEWALGSPGQLPRTRAHAPALLQRIYDVHGSTRHLPLEALHPHLPTRPGSGPAKPHHPPAAGGGGPKTLRLRGLWRALRAAKLVGGPRAGLGLAFLNRVFFVSPPGHTAQPYLFREVCAAPSAVLPPFFLFEVYRTWPILKGQVSRLVTARNFFPPGIYVSAVI